MNFNEEKSPRYNYNQNERSFNLSQDTIKVNTRSPG